MTRSRDGGLVNRLRAAGSVFAEEEARLLADSAESLTHLASMVERRIGGDPLEVVLGWADCCGLRIIVHPGVFVPRRRTGILVDEGAKGLADDAVVVDLCCGTGAVGLALHAQLPGIELHASDVDPAAVTCAVANIGPIGAHVHEGDLYSALPDDLRGRVDLLVVNAPYVPTDAIALMPPEARDHEPLIALDGGPDGLDVHRRVARDAREWLSPTGRLIIETSREQAPLTARAIEVGGLSARVVSSADLDGTAVVGVVRAS